MKMASFILLIGVAAGISVALLRQSNRGPSGEKRRLPRWQRSFTDINSADPGDLEKLGLDRVAAERIVENRPYRNKLELVSRMVIPEKLYGAIRHQIGVREAGATVKVA